MTTERSHMTDAGTQTYVHTPATTPNPEQSEDGRQCSIGHETKELEPIQEPEEVDYTKIDISALRKLSAFPDLDEPLDFVARQGVDDELRALTEEAEAQGGAADDTDDPADGADGDSPAR